MEKVLKSYRYDAEYASERYSELRKKEEESHNYVFIGKVGQFCPIKQGCNGGLLMRNSMNKKAPVCKLDKLGYKNIFFRKIKTVLPFLSEFTEAETL